MAWGQQKVFLYIPSNGASALTDFTVNTGTGALTPAGTVGTSTAPWEVIVAPNNKFVYVASNGSIDAYTVDLNGALTVNTGAGIIAPGTIVGLAIDNSGKYLFTSNLTAKAIQSYTIDASTGKLTALGTTALTPWTVGGLAVDSTNHLYLAVPNDVSTPTGFVASYTIAANGSLTAIGTFNPGTPHGPQRVVIAPANGTHGELVISPDFFDSKVSVFTISGGTLSLVGGAVPVGGAGSKPYGGAVTPNGAVLILTDAGTPVTNVQTYTIGAGGVLSSAGVFNAGTDPAGVTIDPTGANAFVANQSSNNITRFAIAGNGVLSGATNTGGVTTPLFLTTHLGPAPLSTVPTLQTWVLVVLGFMLAALAFFMSRKAVRQS